MVTENNDEALLTPAQVARRLGVSPVTVRSWVSKGWLPACTTPGGHSRFKWSDVSRFVEARQAERPRAEKLKILIIDDEPQIRNYLRESISIMLPDAIIREAVDGFNAGHELASMVPDLILLDYNMPGLNGLSVCKMIRENPVYDATQIVAISGYATDEIASALKEAGADKLLHKPISLKDIQIMLAELNLFAPI